MSLKTKNIIIAGIIFAFIGCGVQSCKDNRSESVNEKGVDADAIDDKPLHPDVKTDFGEIGNYKTMDEYYIDKNGNKQWHGYRKNLYPTGQPSIVSFYEHGKLIWTEKYDEVGNVISTDRK